MNLQTLKTQVRSGRIDTVVVALPDPLGRLVGKRFRAAVFLDSIAQHGTHGCNYLLTANMEMDPQDGFKVASWDTGFGDFAMVPDLDTLRLIPWQPGAALVLCDHVQSESSLVPEAPRSVLRRQLASVKQAGWSCFCASELEFYLFNQTYHSAYTNGYRDLQPSSDYRIDYHLMQPSRDEPLMRAIRNDMTAARVPIESSKGEFSPGQHEITFTYDEPLAMADMHVLFKQGIKELAEQHGKAVSFMAKYAPSEAGNSCHIHISLWQNGRNMFWSPSARKANGPAAHGSTVFRHFLGGLMKYSPELCLCFAPTINSYKRYQPGSWAPTRMAWAHDNRTVGFRVVGEDNSFRIENRMPGADANPYLAFAAMLAAGLAGLKEKLDCGGEYSGNAYVDPKLARLPATLRDAANLLDKSALARGAFGDDVVDFYVHHARLEVDAFHNAVTDWEKIRYFERI
jgi:glutamine synthetase